MNIQPASEQADTPTQPTYATAEKIQNRVLPQLSVPGASQDPFTQINNLELPGEVADKIGLPLGSLGYRLEGIALRSRFRSDAHLVTKATSDVIDIYFIHVPKWFMASSDPACTAAFGMIAYAFPEHARIFVLSKGLDIVALAYVLMVDIWKQKFDIDVEFISWGHIKDLQNVDSPTALASLLHIDRTTTPPPTGMAPPVAVVQGSARDVSDVELRQVSSFISDQLRGAMNAENYVRGAIDFLDLPLGWRSQLGNAVPAVDQLVRWAKGMGEYPPTSTWRESKVLGVLIFYALQSTGRSPDSEVLYRLAERHELISAGRLSELAQDHGPRE